METVESRTESSRSRRYGYVCTCIARNTGMQDEGI